MPEPEDDFEDFESEDAGFVPAVFARSQAEAEEYCELLNDHDIPARTGADEVFADEEGQEHRQADRRGMTHGVPVLVPDTLLEEASEIIADRDEFLDTEEEEAEEEEEDDAFGLGEEGEEAEEAEDEEADVLQEDEEDEGEEELEDESDGDDSFFDDDEPDDETEA